MPFLVLAPKVVSLAAATPIPTISVSAARGRERQERLHSEPGREKWLGDAPALDKGLFLTSDNQNNRIWQNNCFIKTMWVEGEIQLYTILVFYCFVFLVHFLVQSRKSSQVGGITLLSSAGPITKPIWS